MTLGTVRGYTLRKHLAFDGSNPYSGTSSDGLPVFIRLTASVIFDTKHAVAVLQFLNRYRQLHHPALLKVCDAWIEGRYLGLVTDWADGGSFSDRLRQQGPFAGRELVSLFTPLSEALDFLHRQGIRHDDIRPENLLLRQGVPYLDVPRLPSSGFGTIVSWNYTAPELESQQSDQYSLAASYAKLRLGRSVFSKYANDSHAWSLSERQSDLQPLPEREQLVIRRALATDPGERYPTCLTFLKELGSAVP
jgi:serine/threonine-protein kinase